MTKSQVYCFFETQCIYVHTQIAASTKILFGIIADDSGTLKERKADDSCRVIDRSYLLAGS